MKILIIIPKYNLSINEDYTYTFPLGLAYISSAIKKTNKHSVTCLNLNHYSGTIEKLVTDTLNKEKYDLVCTGGNSLTYHSIKKITTTVQSHINSPQIILGGPIITSEPELMFNLLNPNFAVIGEGESTIIELLNCIEKKEDLEKINGIICKKNNQIIITKPRDPIKNIEFLPLPDFEAMEFEKYLDNAHCNDSWLNQAFDYPRSYPLLASRGCPFSCTFCWHAERYRARSIKDIMNELEIMVPLYKINYITMYDDCFSTNKERLYEFCKEIKKFSTKLSWDLKWCCQLLVNTVDEELLKTLKDAGCDNMAYGFESYSQKVLNSMRKPITPEQINKTLKATLKANIGIHGNFIFGDVAETKETAKETLDYWKSCPEAQQIVLGFIQPYPGSELYKHCFEKGIIKDKISYITEQMSPDAIVNMTNGMSDEEINELNKERLDTFRKYFHFVIPTSLHQTKKNIYEFDFKCPFCKEIVHYKNCFIKNKFTYGFHLICRNCHMRSAVVSPMQKFAYKHYTKTRKMRDIYIQIKKSLNKKRV